MSRGEDPSQLHLLGSVGRHRGRWTPLTPLYAKEVSIIEANCRTGWRQCQCPPWPRDPLLSFLKAVSVTRRMTMVSTAPPWCSHSPSCPPLVPLWSPLQAATICPRQIQRDRAHLAPLTLLRLLIPLTAPSSRNTPTITPRAALPFTAAATRYQSGGFFLGKPAAAVGMVILGCSGQERTHRGRCVLTGCAPAPPTITLRCTEQCSPDRVITTLGRNRFR